MWRIVSDLSYVRKLAIYSALTNALHVVGDGNVKNMLCVISRKLWTSQVVFFKICVLCFGTGRHSSLCGTVSMYVPWCA